MDARQLYDRTMHDRLCAGRYPRIEQSERRKQEYYARTWPLDLVTRRQRVPRRRPRGERALSYVCAAFQDLADIVS